MTVVIALAPGLSATEVRPCIAASPLPLVFIPNTNKDIAPDVCLESAAGALNALGMALQSKQITKALRDAKLWRKLGQIDRALAAISSVSAARTIVQDEKQQKTASSAPEPVLIELARCWLASGDTKNVSGARQLAESRVRTQNSPSCEWLSIACECRAQTVEEVPFVSGVSVEQTPIIIVPRGPQNVQRLLHQFQTVARIPFSVVTLPGGETTSPHVLWAHGSGKTISPPTAAMLAPADERIRGQNHLRARELAKSASKSGVALILESHCILGPTFLRDWTALHHVLTLLPKMSSVAVALGAVATVQDLTSVVPRTVNLNGNVPTDCFAYAITVASGTPLVPLQVEPAIVFSAVENLV
jgi:hypothetical protein